MMCVRLNKQWVDEGRESRAKVVKRAQNAMLTQDEVSNMEVDLTLYPFCACHCRISVYFKQHLFSCLIMYDTMIFYLWFHEVFELR